jgi:anti-anti-sigma regulatory factor
MTARACAITVKQLPEKLSGKGGRLFFRGLGRSMNIDRACIVLDCSQVRQIDRSAVYLLLRCLEDAMMRDVDVKLAAVSSEAKAMLQFTGADRLFECFGTEAEAIRSFRQLSVDADSGANVDRNSGWARESLV